MGSGKSTLNTILLYTVEINNNYNVLHWTLHVYTWLNDNLRSSWGPMKLNPKEKLHWITFFSKMKCNAEEKVHWIYNILLNKMECGGKTALDLKIYFRLKWYPEEKLHWITYTTWLHISLITIRFLR